MKVSYAPDAWKLLNGVFCAYKPAEITTQLMRETIIGNLCRDLNRLKVRPPQNFVKIEGSVTSGELTVTNVPSYADHPLVIGERYQPDDIRCAWYPALRKLTSGICVIGLNDGCRFMKKLRSGNFVKTYELCGRFGFATDNFHMDGKVLKKTTYDHITKQLIDRLAASWQSSHQKHMFQHAGVHPQSQEAYELAAKGPFRPADKSVSLIYSLKCTKFNPPDFTLEVSCINEDQTYLMTLIHDLGLDLKSTACVTKIRLTHFGHFNVNMALLRKHWTLEHIINNILHCKPLVSRENITPSTPYLTEIKKEGSSSHLLQKTES